MKESRELLCQTDQFGLTPPPLREFRAHPASASRARPTATKSSPVEASTPSSVDELLRRFDRGDFDLVAVGRALLADAGWARKIREGRSSELIGFGKEALATLS